MPREMKHTIQQHRKFFALVAELGWDKEKAMAKAKAKYNKFHFSDLDADMLNELIKIMDTERRKKVSSALSQFKCRIWNHDENRMLYEDDFISKAYWQIDFDGANASMSVKSVDKATRLDILFSAGRLDHFGKELYQMDIVIDRNKKKWLVDWSTKDLAWIGSSFDEPQETKLLSAFSALKKIGDVYQGVEEGEEHDKQK